MGEDQQPATKQDETETEQQPQNRWGAPISDARKAELQAILDAWDAPDANHGDRMGPFDGIVLGGGDVFWLDQQMGSRVRLQRAYLGGAVLTGAYLSHAVLTGAAFDEAHLEGASFRLAHLEGANLNGAWLKWANLGNAWLERAYLANAHLEGANLRAAVFDSKTVLNNATLDAKSRLGDIQWGGVGAVNLTQINWEQVPRLGDEQGSVADPTLDDQGRSVIDPMDRTTRMSSPEDVVRAYRQLATQLRTQGMAEVADHFAERGQVRQRKLLFRRMLADWRRPWRFPGDLLRWLFSWFLALLAGYGYHPGRSVFWYLATIFGFAFAYYQATHGLPIGPYHFAQLSDTQALQPNEALILSVSSFHGRGFFQPIKSLGDPVATLAAGEAIIGLLIEISFIATFTQRFFGAK
jgi:hypothetical protein